MDFFEEKIKIRIKEEIKKLEEKTTGKLPEAISLVKNSLKS